MRKMLSLPLALALPFVLFATPLAAQTKGGKKKPAPAKAAAVEPPAPPTPAKVELVLVNDRRSSGSFANLTVHFVLPDVLDKDVAAQRAVPKTATDDTGKDLVAGAMQSSGLAPTSAGMGFSKEGEPASPNRMDVTLASPARGASSVKEITGEIELYMPAKDPNATVKIEKILDKVGKKLANPALASNGVEITFLSKAQLDAEKKKRADKKKVDLKKEGYPAESLEDALKSFVENLVTPEEGELVATVKDPGKRIESFAYVTPSGEQKRVVGMDRDGFTVFASWGAKPQPDWGLKIALKTPKAFVRHTFTLSDVALP